MASNPKRRSDAKQRTTAKKAKQVTKPQGKEDRPQALPHKPGVSPTAVDVTGITPEDVHVDPNLTEGHPGYEESGTSELHPPR